MILVRIKIIYIAAFFYKHFLKNYDEKWLLHPFNGLCLVIDCADFFGVVCD